MKTITVAQLRKSLTAALDEIEHGGTHLVTRPVRLHDWPLWSPNRWN